MPKKEKTKKLWDPSRSASDNAKTVLPLLAVRFFEAGRKVAGEGAAPAKLHSFRLKAKRFRYTLELFRGCYGPGLDDRLAGLRQVQNYLGGISDCAATRGRLDEMKLRRSAQLEAFQKFLDLQEASRTEEFKHYWSRDFDAPERQKWWTNYLSRFAGRKGKRKRG